MYKEEINDLIYLVIDGEATESENDTLFRHLSSDMSLREEFQDALRISRNIDIEKKNISPSANLSDALFKKAGISTIYLNQHASVQSSIPKNSYFLSPVKDIFNSGLLSKILFSLLFFSLGVVSTVVFINLAGEKVVFNGMKVSDVFETKLKVSNLSDNPKKNTFKKEEDIAEITSKNQNHRNNNTNNFKNNSVDDEAKLVLVPSPDRQELNLIEPAEIIKLKSPIKKDSMLINYDITTLPIDDKYPLEQQKSIIDGFSFELKGLGGLLYFPNRNLINSPPPNVNNIAFALSYGINENQIIGIEYGIATYPIFIKDRSHNFYPIKSLTYFGGFYQIDIGKYNFYGTIVPNIKLFTGGTGIGLLLRESVGITYIPESYIGFTLGFENLGVISNYRAKINYTDKIGLYYGINIKF